MAVFVFDIETVPDVELGRRIYGLHGLSDREVGDAMQAKRRESSGSEFLSLEQQRVVAISVAMRMRDSFRVWSLGEPESPEAELIQRFFDGIEKYIPDTIAPCVTASSRRATGRRAMPTRRSASTTISVAITRATWT
jgi:predicted PolB exonuclease-like 3'-5' exonuclease